MMRDANIQIFIKLVRAGLWGKEARLSQYTNIDFNEVYRLSVEQSVIGLVLVGLEFSDVKPPQELLLQWIGEAQLIEQRNKAMNEFVAKLIERLRSQNIYALLVKGQGMAQCYEKPLCRTSGDIDLLLSEDNYEKAKVLLTPLTSSIDEERPATKHIAMSLDSWEVELHGTLRSKLWRSVDKVLDEIKEEVFCRGTVSSWNISQTQIFILNPDENVVYVFSHILKHFFRGGIGLRQICDWCRLLWTYKNLWNHGLLESRIRSMGVMTEWKAFAALAVNSLGMPAEAMPFYSPGSCWYRKGNAILSYILEAGNFGHNRDITYQSKYPAFIRKLITFKRQVKYSLLIMRIFPLDAIKSLYSFWKSGIKAAVK